jgi:HAD superfamily hydrolase (TIGR01549 family)
VGNSKRKFLSFDLDGTLIQLDFSLALWHEAIPKLVASQGGFPIDEATKWVTLQYETVGEESLEWYDLAYWYERFRLKEPWKATLRRYRHMIRPFPEVTDVLRALAKDHRMMILSNASRPFVQAELEDTGLCELFDHVVSATSDLGEVKKTHGFYAKVCHNLGIEPFDVIHVGDHWEFDYLAPSKAGLTAYFLDRSGRRNGPWVVNDLKEFAGKVIA